MNKAMLARHYAVGTRTISNYVRKGLLPPPTAQGPSGRDLWDDSVVKPKTDADNLANASLPLESFE